MIEFEIDIPESRQVTFTLPPDAPTGRVSVVVTENNADGASVCYYRPTDPVVASEFDGFLRLLPMLRVMHGGHYVAVRAGQVIASGLYLDAVLKLAKAETGEAPFFCEWVEPASGYTFRSGLVEVLPAAERA
jgi:hypothetical protein